MINYPLLINHRVGAGLFIPWWFDLINSRTPDRAGLFIPWWFDLINSRTRPYNYP
ncbi:hypothetical protein [Limnospira sp. PMC 289.06]|uniref:hypothetical protein n=1 Tax=Limnospira sp. PMC 289.06 TaxID=2981094 RepID=UPI0028E0D6B7|nr:hypothetical protein [Limnospira sp. PMC 289.06]